VASSLREEATIPDSPTASRSGSGTFALAEGACQRLRHAHGIWHLFVLLGSLCHFVAVIAYVR
jgi:predicted membrane channel-forming protein YqfA (hemolysin III family)